MLVTATVWFDADSRGWVALEFLAWWVRDLSRGGQAVHMRPLALPPVGYGTQLGRTLKFAIEFFFINQGESLGPVLKKLGDLAESLEEQPADLRQGDRPPDRGQPARLRGPASVCR